MKILTLTTLFPNEIEQYHGIFVENRLRKILQFGGKNIEARVIAPVPFFPSRSRIFGGYARFASVPRQETRGGIRVLHPRYPVIPKVGTSLAPRLMYEWLRPVIRKVLQTYKFDVIDSHFFYPDGVTAVMLGRNFRKPVVVTARGSDINVFPQHASARKRIRWAAERAQASITVSRALADALRRLGAPADRLVVLRNGVDLEQFRPMDRHILRRRYGASGLVLLSAGKLVEGKGHDLVIRALTSLNGATCLVVGWGPWHRSCKPLRKNTASPIGYVFSGPGRMRKCRCFTMLPMSWFWPHIERECLTSYWKLWLAGRQLSRRQLAVFRRS